MIKSSTLCVCAVLGLSCLPITPLRAVGQSIDKTSRSARESKHTLRLVVRERGNKQAIPFATVRIPSLGIGAAADINGVVSLKNVPGGRYIIELSSVGYSRLRREVNLASDLSMTLDLDVETLGLKEITVTAKRSEDSPATSSTIGRQAIDHLQAMSLADVVQLVPGQLLTTTDLTQRSNLQLRGIVNNNTSAFGTSIVVDGVPISNNAAMSAGPFSGTAFVGTDLRNISVDDVDAVEVVRGIPSAEYGDLSSGLMIAKSRVGVSPLTLRAKLNPANYNLSASRGWRLGEAGVLNLSLDYANASGDPRNKTRTYDRYNLSLGYATDLSPIWSTTTKLRYGYGKDWSGKDPDAIADGSESWAKNHNLSLNHSAKIKLDKPWSRNINYTLGLTLGVQDSYNASIIASPTGFTNVITALTTGYHEVKALQGAYLGAAYTESRPFSLFAKVSNQLNATTGGIKHNISMGVDYALDKNSGRGYYNVDDTKPLRPNAEGRPRAFDAVPAAHRLSAYIEDNLRIRLGDKRVLRLMAGLRFTALQPGSEVSAYSLSPRLNARLNLSSWLDLNAGIGWNAKTPGLDYLYPMNKYTDNLSANYFDASNPAGHYVLYHTYVQELSKSQNLRNALTRKIELGADIKLGAGRKLSLTAFHDYTNNGFEAYTRYQTYSYNLYNATQGLIITPGAATRLDPTNPASTRTIFVTTGGIGNTDVSLNRGVELELELGEIKPLRTQVFLSGAYNESKSWSEGPSYSSPKALPVGYSGSGHYPILFRFASGEQKSTYRRALNTLRLVTHIPELRMVASFTGQVVWYNYSYTSLPRQTPIAWLGTDLREESITSAMLADPNYMIEGVKLSEQARQESNAVPTKQPISWQLSARLTKELGKAISISLFSNNLLYHEPFLSSSVSTTLTQRSTGTFSFGAELSVKL